MPELNGFGANQGNVQIQFFQAGLYSSSAIFVTLFDLLNTFTLLD